MNNIIEILNKHSIEVKERGSNVGAGNVNIKCPFCSNDPSFHMGIKIDGTGYGCLRNSLHRGKKVAYLFVKLLHVTEEQANTILGIKIHFIEEEDYLKAIKTIKQTVNEIKKPGTLDFLSDFKTIKNSGTTQRFWRYLENRNFTDVENIIKKYKLKCCLTGDYEFRIIIPVYLNNKLVTWTGRTIREVEKIRYKSLKAEKSVIKITDVLFNYDFILEGGETLFICEGPFDSLNLQQHLPASYKSTCLFTKNISSRQISLFYELRNLFTKFVVLLDKNEEAASLKISYKLDFLKNVKMYFLKDCKDPGELKKEQISEIIRNL